MHFFYLGVTEMQYLGLIPAKNYNRKLQISESHNTELMKYKV